MNLNGYDEILFFSPLFLSLFEWKLASQSQMKCVFLHKHVMSQLLHEEFKVGNLDIYKTRDALMETFESFDVPAGSLAVASLVWATANIQEEVEWRLNPTTRLICPFSLPQTLFG